mmetsp:Transcript_8454/g.20355  ORF Transcript_8454/g.20355 Transcript_8454/m.20355 type:complete len:255 (+) Transcript_8454:371-1135(+)
MQRLGVEGVLQGRHLVQHHAEAPHVRLEVVRLVLDDFRTQVVGRSHHGLCVVFRGVQHPGNPEIPELHLPALVQKNVLRLQITVQHLALVHVPQRETDLCKPAEYHILRQEFALPLILGSLFLDFHVHVPPIAILHHDAESSLPRHEDFVELDNVGVAAHPFQDRCLLHSLVPLLLAHLHGLHLFHDAECGSSRCWCSGPIYFPAAIPPVRSSCACCSRARVLDKESLAERALAEHADALVLLHGEKILDPASP